MIDIHCHILSGVDDGPETLDQSIAMCRRAAGEGIRTIVATPHFIPGRSESTPTVLLEKTAELKNALNQEAIPLTILTGADVSVTPELRSWLETESCLTINNKRYFLAELPHMTVPPGWDRFLLSLLSSGKVPILTHPERNPWFIDHPDALYAFVVQGGMVQITAMSLTGGCGERVRDFSLLLLKHNLVHAIATDAHDCELRPPVLTEAVNQAAKIIGERQAHALVTTTPKAIIEGRSLPRVDATPPDWKKKKTWIQKLVSSFSEPRTENQDV